MEEEQELPDAFALQRHVLHPILAENKVVGAGVDISLFEKFFESHAFIAWSSGTRSWQLHCHGEPGCGKVTNMTQIACYIAHAVRLPLLLLLRVEYLHNKMELRQQLHRSPYADIS